MHACLSFMVARPLTLMLHALLPRLLDVAFVCGPSRCAEDEGESTVTGGHRVGVHHLAGLGNWAGGVTRLRETQSSSPYPPLLQTCRSVKQCVMCVHGASELSVSTVYIIVINASAGKHARRNLRDRSRG